MKRFNLYGDEWDDEQEREEYRWRAQMIGPVIGASLVGATVYELPPGEKSFPYHYEYGNEEWLLVVAGRPTLRTPEGEQELEPGDVVCFPEGPRGAHQVQNRTEEPARIVFLSTKRTPAVAVYPDSDKLGIWPGAGDATDRILVRRDSAVDYWDGE
ncbi:MAG: cupin domain-containing protein [Actinomycetota bacterium]|nr:cupin domain-containing protein [Actinomycetota bacterium]